MFSNIILLIILFIGFSDGMKLKEPSLKSENGNGGYVQLDLPMTGRIYSEGETIEIMCEITGSPLPRYHWFKNSIIWNDLPPDTRARMDFNILPWGSRLIIKEARVSDSGVYGCTGYNAFEEKSTNATITVRSLGLYDGFLNFPHNGKRNEDLELYPDLNQGLPEIHEGPHIKQPDNTEADHIGGAIDQHQRVLIIVPIPWETLESWTWKCDASGLTLSILMWRKASKHIHSPDGDADIERSACHRYIGSVCLTVFGNTSVHVPFSKLDQEYMERRINVLLTMVASLDVSEGCGKHILPAICHATFASCTSVTQRNSAAEENLRYLCRSDCETMEQKICHEELKEINRVHHIGHPMRSLNCKKLPVFEGKQCTHILDGNRLVAAPSIENKPASAKTTTKFNDDIGLALIPVIIICILIPIIIVTLLAIKYFLNSSKSRQTNHSASLHNSTSNTDTELCAVPLIWPYPAKTTEISPEKILLMEELGQGLYGTVFRGEFRDVPNRGSPVDALPVAVRSLRADMDYNAKERFWKEADFLATLKHPNITCLLGCSSRSSAMSMIFQLSCNLSKDLHEYLQERSPFFEFQTYTPDGHIPTMQYSEVLHILVQVAQGMEYLSSKKYVHKDLAARNIFIGGMSIVKVSLFDHSRLDHDISYCTVIPGMPPLPIRWMPAEVLGSGRFTTQSDVWAFGVTMWEAVTYGIQPYFGYSNAEVLTMIQSHHLLQCPDGCQNALYKLMLECWNRRPNFRPEFRQIRQRLELLQKETVIVKSFQPSGLIRHPSFGRRPSRGVLRLTSNGQYNPSESSGVSFCTDSMPKSETSGNNFSTSSKEYTFVEPWNALQSNYQNNPASNDFQANVPNQTKSQNEVGENSGPTTTSIPVTVHATPSFQNEVSSKGMRSIFAHGNMQPIKDNNTYGSMPISALPSIHSSGIKSNTDNKADISDVKIAPEKNTVVVGNATCRFIPKLSQSGEKLSQAKNSGDSDHMFSNEGDKLLTGSQCGDSIHNDRIPSVCNL